MTDNLTGLMWEQKTDDGGSRDKDNKYTWKDALAYCENLVLGNQSDWRMPTPKEYENGGDWQNQPSENRTRLPISPIPATDCTGQEQPAAVVTEGRLLLKTSVPAIYFMGTSIMKRYIMKIMCAVLQMRNQRWLTLSSFTASPKTNKVVLQWSTESEIDNAGFNLYRANSENGNYT